MKRLDLLVLGSLLKPLPLLVLSVLNILLQMADVLACVLACVLADLVEVILFVSILLIKKILN